jgi:3-phenylpropionate/trans-cinnamate dioxygenase ferredoxin reductase subunit
MRLGCEVVAIDRTQRQVLLARGPAVTYRRLLLATGAEPFQLPVPGAELAGIHYLRSVEDALALGTALKPGARLAVVGGGLIGMEVAVSARARGCAVTVIEGLSRLMLRSVPPEVGAVIEARHRGASVEIALDAVVTAFLGGHAVNAVALADGAKVPCEAVLVATGARPRVGLAAAADLATDNGVACSASLRTSDPLIYCAGDLCSYPHGLFGVRIRSEHWRNAEDQGRHVAGNLLGASRPFLTVPWFWSDQYDLTIQGAGLFHLGTSHVVRNGGGKAIMTFHFAPDGRLIGVADAGTSAGIGRDVRIGEKLIERGARPDPRALADPDTNLKALLKGETV